ncbi:MAG: translation initiation factor IF-3 [Candidatus Kerfeldbacteria bacterium]|nr:translation initiation factor IF-3 [Candidatus Kerfeldbacteria bacterium]
MPQVVVIDDQAKHLGEMDTVQALALAQERGLDLVEVAPMARPPVCKILDFGAFIYQQERQQRKARAGQKKVDLKGVRLTFGIGHHDRERQRLLALKFLEEGHKVQVELRLRGRQNAHRQLAQKNVGQFITDLGDQVVTEQPINILGNRITAIVGRKK